MAQRSNPSKDFLESVGDKIRYYRQKRGFTLEALGDDIGLDKGNMHRIEAGKNITLLTLVKIALFLDIEPGKLIGNKVDLSLKDAESMVSKKRHARARSKSKTKTKRKPAKRKR
ncbi:hypothetical protein BH09BAC5_BH09BAC5_25170 [soil metagenome]